LTLFDNYLTPEKYNRDNHQIGTFFEKQFFEQVSMFRSG